MATTIKFTKFDNRPWGFRLAGGSDFPQPLTVIRVTEGSLAECMGLRVGDVIVRLNDQSISTLSHGQAHEALNLAGNNFVLAIHRVEDTETLVEAITKDEIEPYSINLDDLPPLQPLEEILTKLTAEPVIEDPPEEEIVEESFEERIEIIEEVPDKPKDENSEEIPNQNLTDEEIAQLIIVEEELLPEKGVLGVNFKKLRPRAPLFKDSKVFEELQKEATAEPPLIQELKRSTTFLQKPERPIPKPKSATAEESTLTQPQETYKVVIKKQTKKSITERLVEKGLLEPGCVKSSDQGSEVKMFVPSWVAEVDTQQFAPQSTNFVNFSESSNLVNFSEIIDINDSIGTSNSSNSSESSNFMNSPEPLPDSLVPEVSKLNLKLPNSSEIVNLTSASSLTMDKCGLIFRPKRLYMRNRYFENCVLKKKSTGLKKKGVGSSRLYRKGHYVTKIVSSLTQSRPSGKSKIRSYKLSIRGHYVQRYLGRKSKWAIERTKCGIQSLLSSRKGSSKNFQRRGRYMKRIIAQYVDSSKVVFNSLCVSSSLESPSPRSSLMSSLRNEIFHRGCKRLWSKYRTESGWIDWLKNLSGISLKVTKKVSVQGEMVCNKKPLDMDNLNDSRRLSFVPTVLYDGLTNRIGVDFTRFVVYAFVPCASMVLLYAYK